MIYLIYVSSAVKAMSRQELLDLLVKAREKNQRLGVTGMLLYKGGNFMQVLEGEEDVIRAVYDTITHDPRHRDKTLINEGPLEQRQFGDWSMAFRDLDDPVVQAIPGYSDFMNKSLTAVDFQNDPNGCMALLRLFSDGR